MESFAFPSSSTSQPLFPRMYQRNAQRIALPYLNRNIMISVDDVISLQGEGNYTFIVTRDKKRYLVSKTLKAFEQMLDPSMFLRIHKSTIINLAYVQFSVFANEHILRMTDGQEVTISRRRTKEISQRLNHFMQTLFEN
jgi:two-component system, LytTR family, response regulator